jgi:hypothetical protein
MGYVTIFRLDLPAAPPHFKAAPLQMHTSKKGRESVADIALDFTTSRTHRHPHVDARAKTPPASAAAAA